jgi:hypothetical protein
MRLQYTVDKSKENSNIPFPAGDYFLTCIDVQDTDKNDEILRSRNGDQMVCLELIVSEGEYEGRHLWHYITFMSPESKGYGIALHALHAFGLPYEDGLVEFDTQDFKDRTVKVKVGIQPSGTVNGKSYSDKNVIKDFYIMDDAPVKQQVPSPVVPEAVNKVFPKSQVISTGKKLPWSRK